MKESGRGAVSSGGTRTGPCLQRGSEPREPSIHSAHICPTPTVCFIPDLMCVRGELMVQVVCFRGQLVVLFRKRAVKLVVSL